MNNQISNNNFCFNFFENIDYAVSYLTNTIQLSITSGSYQNHRISLKTSTPPPEIQEEIESKNRPRRHWHRYYVPATKRQLN